MTDKTGKHIKKYKFFILCIAVIAFLISGCEKDNKYRHQMSGVWNIESISMEYYTDGNPDSTASVSDAGVWLLTDNALDPYNIMEYEHTCTPPSLNYVLGGLPALQPSDGELDWYPAGEERLTIWAIDPNGITESFVIYTVQKLRKNTMELIFIIPESTSHIAYKEVLVLKRI